MKLYTSVCRADATGDRRPLHFAFSSGRSARERVAARRAASRRATAEREGPSAPSRFRRSHGFACAPVTQARNKPDDVSRLGACTASTCCPLSRDRGLLVPFPLPSSLSPYSLDCDGTLLFRNARELTATESFYGRVSVIFWFSRQKSHGLAVSRQFLAKVKERRDRRRKLVFASQLFLCVVTMRRRDRRCLYDYRERRRLTLSGSISTIG